MTAMTSGSVHNRTLTGNVAFTNSWKFPWQSNSSPIVVMSDSTLTGTLFYSAQEPLPSLGSYVSCQCAGSRFASGGIRVRPSICWGRKGDLRQETRDLGRH